MTQFTRKVDGYDGDWVRADDINELQEAIETIEGGVTGGLPALDARLDIIESGVYNVLTYGAVGDGVTDDTVAIQAAIDAAAVDGGGTVWFPEPESYLVSMAGQYAGSSGDWALRIDADNITLDGVPGAEIKATTDTTILWIEGGAKPAGPDDWADYWLMDPTTGTYYDIDEVDRGDKAITLSTAAEASNFVAGDDIFIRTGQVNTTDTLNPDAELNQVISADSGTGVLVLKYPLTRGYAAENYPTGHANAGNPTTFGVQKCTDRLVRNVRIQNLKLTSEATSEALFAGNQIDGFWIENCELHGKCAMQNMNVFRNFHFNGNTITLDSSGEDDWWLSTAVACTDGEIARNHFWSTNKTANLHVHISGRVTVANNHFGRAPENTALNQPVINIQARAYSVNVLNNEIDAPGDYGLGIYVSHDCPGGGIIAGNRVLCHPTTGLALGVGATGWALSLNDFTGRVSFYNDAAGGLIAGGGAGPMVTETISNWVTPSQQTAGLGVVPSSSVIREITMYVTQAFNSDGTDEISVGYSGSAAAFAGPIDVSTDGVKAITLWSEPNYVANLREAQATYANGGTAPTTGKALITLTYTRVASAPT